MEDSYFGNHLVQLPVTPVLFILKNKKDDVVRE